MNLSGLNMSARINIENSIEYIEKYFKILTKGDKSGLSDLVPMTLWPSQRHYIENRTHRDIAVKNRQTGFSTGVEAANSHKLFVFPYQRQSIIAHDQEASEFLFQTVQRFYGNLPEDMKPKSDWYSGNRMRFPVMDSYIYVDSARSDNLGIGRTLNIAHLSELGKWPAYKADSLFADISQTVPEGGYITIESTPKGRGGLFYRLYDAAKRGDINYKAFFYPWWWDVTAIRETEKIYKYTDEENALIRNFQLNDRQIAFRREKIAELRDLFYQEYPEDDVNCWLSSDVSVFDGSNIRKYLQNIMEGSPEGNLTIWKDVIGGEKYIIGADPAGGYEKGDFSVASVLRVRTNEYVARLRGKIAPDFFGQELLRLGHRYNDALIGVERIMHGHTILKILLDNIYPEIYYREEYDNEAGHVAQQPGWVTSGKTKPMMLDIMKAAMRAGDFISYSENLMLEAAGLIWEGQKMKTQPGGYDDELDAFMIALMIRESIPIFEPKRTRIRSYARL